MSCLPDFIDQHTTEIAVSVFIWHFNRIYLLPTMLRYSKRKFSEIHIFISQNQNIILLCLLPIITARWLLLGLDLYAIKND